MRNSWPMVLAAIALVALGVLAVWRSPRKKPAPQVVAVPTVVSFPPSSAAPSPLDPKNLFLSSGDEARARVKRAFPDGVASEDATAQIGTAAAEPGDDVIDLQSSFVVSITLASPVTGETIRAASPPDEAGVTDTSNGEETVLLHTLVGKGPAMPAWVQVSDAQEDTTFDHLAVKVDLINDGAPVPASRFSREAAWARGLAKHLGAKASEPSMPPAQAEKKGKAALDLRQKYVDETLEVSVLVKTPDGRPFVAKKVWDAMYSAGFEWGDGDYFHWFTSQRPGRESVLDVSTTTSPGYFLPETVSNPSSDVEDVEIGFNLALTFKPTQVGDVMARAAGYFAKRLGGTVVDAAGKPFDPRALHEHAAAIESEMNARGVAPGSDLAQLVF